MKFLEPYSSTVKAIIYIATVIVVVLSLWFGYNTIWQNGYDSADNKWSLANEKSKAKHFEDILKIQQYYEGLSDVDIAGELKQLHTTLKVNGEACRKLCPVQVQPELEFIRQPRAEMDTSPQRDSGIYVPESTLEYNTIDYILQGMD